MIITGLDIGTTSICGITLDSKTGKVLKSITLPNTAALKPQKAFERLQDTGGIMKTVFEILDGLGAAGTACIGVSGQMHGIVYYDENGSAVSPLYTWQDSRAALEYAHGKTYAQEVKCAPGYGLATHFYNRENGLVPSSAAGLCTAGDFAVMTLCGKKDALTHITNAASLGGFSLEESRFTADDPLLPRVSKDFVTAGDYRGVPVCVAAGDNQASFAGSVSSDDSLLINIGTGAQVSFLTDEFTGTGALEIRPFDGRKNLAAGCSLCGGRAFSLLEKLYREIARLAGAEKESLYPEIDALLEGRTSSTLKADCRFCGTRADGSLRGSVTGIDENNFTAADLAFAVCSGMVDELFEMLPENKTFGEYICSGNGILKNAAVLGITERRAGRKLKTPVCGESASYGAALAAGTACGIFESLDSARRIIEYRSV